MALNMPLRAIQMSLTALSDALRRPCNLLICWVPILAVRKEVGLHAGSVR